MRSKDRIQVQDSGVCGYDPLCQNLNKYKLNCLSEISEKNSGNWPQLIIRSRTAHHWFN